jgi:hypothetical protein
MGRGPMQSMNVPLPPYASTENVYSASGTGSFPSGSFSSQSSPASSLPSFVGRGSAPGMSLADSANSRLQRMNNFLSSRFPSDTNTPPSSPSYDFDNMEFPTPVINEDKIMDDIVGDSPQETFSNWLKNVQEFEDSKQKYGLQSGINNPGSIGENRGYDNNFEAIPTAPVPFQKFIDEGHAELADILPDGITFSGGGSPPPPSKSKPDSYYKDASVKEYYDTLYSVLPDLYDPYNPEHTRDIISLMSSVQDSGDFANGYDLRAEMMKPGFNFSSLGKPGLDFLEKYSSQSFSGGGLIKNYNNGGLAQMKGISPGGLGDTVVTEQVASGPGGSSISEEMFSVSGLSEQPTLQEVGSKLNPQQMQLVVTEIKMAIAGQHPQAEMVIEAAREMFGDQFLEEIALSMAEERISMQGDGMSDSIPAMLGEEQVALSEGEYVVPADTVADLGNGSTDAGGRAMDRMVQEVRMQTRGTPAQRPSIDPSDFMPGRGV